MALMSPTTIKFYLQRNESLVPQMTITKGAVKSVSVKGITTSITFQGARGCLYKRLLCPLGSEFRSSPWPISAVGSGLEASITDPKKYDLSLGDAKIVIESRDEDKIQVRVDLTGEETQKALDDILLNLARTAPPIPGFRRTKGGKTSKVPKSFLLQILGRDRVTKFLIQEIVSTTIGEFVEKENLVVKSKINTTQTAEELESSFIAGNEFGFNATIEIEKSEPETTSLSPS